MSKNIYSLINKDRVYMKILFTHELFPPDIAGGGEVTVYEIVKRLKERNVDLIVLCSGNPKIKEYKGIETFRLPVNRYLFNFAFHWIYRYAKKFKPDLIHTNNYNACFPSYVVAKTIKRPILCHIHEVYNEKWLKMRGPIFGTFSRIVERLQVRHDFDKFIFFSSFMRDSAVRIGIPKERTEVIKPGVNWKKFKVGKKEPFVLFVGNLIKRKGLDYLIEAAKRLNNVEFLIVGRGPERNRLEKIATPNVKFLGYVPTETLIDLYSRALVFCLPSIGEGFGIVLLEAMASGCAIVSTIPLDYEGFKVGMGNVDQLVDSIDWLIKNQK
ncbi:MAG TPA: glycosyltransferase family 1 protein, partial [Candidatus Aenigmarchaeota archaeon]|nr:glycosyltransferase family 1 protein [Candidatus Aenigmarchaeota archaeon]